MKYFRITVKDFAPELYVIRQAKTPGKAKADAFFLIHECYPTVRFVDLRARMVA